jgi:hypothetical protein
MQQVRDAGNTNTINGSVVKVISTPKEISWKSPAENSIFNITHEATLPQIIFEFQTEITVDYKWSWAIEWIAKASGLKEKERKGDELKTFKESGVFTSKEKRWVVEFGGKILGGKLTVHLTAGDKKIQRSVVIRGQNPSKESISEYILTLEDLSGFDKLLEQETGSKHFINFDSEPIVAFDQGYGITQVTNPAPSYDQIWSWKSNILAGSALYKQKVKEAKNYLGSQERAYTESQLQHEVFSRWNGGSYHEWDSISKAWIRKKNILCDSTTGNIGWNVDKEKNKNQTKEQLHDRDKDTYKKGTKGQSSENVWTYTGVCYADHVLAD